MAKALATVSDGSRPLINKLHERYARYRAQALSRPVAYRKAGNTAKLDQTAHVNAHRLEQKPAVRERIEYLTRQTENRIAEKRAALEEQLWGVMEANIKDCFETYEVAKTTKGGGVETDEIGKMLTVRKQRAKLLSDLPDDIAKFVEDVTVDRNGNFVPRLYSKSEANRELRKFHNIGRTDDRPESDLSRLSDAELIQQLADQAKQLGVEINLNYDFVAKPAPAASSASEPTEANDGQVIDEAVAQPDAQRVEEERRIADATREMKIAAQPLSQRRQDAPFAGARKKMR